MGRPTIVLLVVELRLSVVGRIEMAEEASTLHTVELHKIAPDMGLHHHVANAPTGKRLNLCSLFLFAGSKNNIALALGTGIAPLQPIAFRTLLGGQRDAETLHLTDKVATV